MREKLFEILEEMGVYFTAEEKDPAKDIDLSEYVQDSYVRIMFALQIEEKLEIAPDEDMLRENNLKSFNHFIQLLENTKPLE